MAPPARATLCVTILCVAAALVASCTFGPPAGFHPLSDPGRRAWSDDESPESLDAAIDQSIRYYQRVPEATVFRYGELIYSPREMIASLELFRCRVRQSESLPAALERDFHVFESVAPAGEGLITGYYEPILPGSPVPTEQLTAAVRARPPDLIEVDLSRFGEGLPPRRLMGRLEDGQLLPYFSRREIEEGQALEGRARPLAYVDAVDLFFLQIQGSGVIRFPDGREMKVTYDGTNGHPYHSLGAELIRREALGREEVTLQSIRAYLREHPERIPALLNTNPSYIFFKEAAEGPLGNIEVPLTPGRSLALDHRLFPKGGLAYLETEVPVPGEPGRTRPLRRFFLVQDTGGAIRGHGRADVFWGSGAEAEWLAGHQKQPGRLFLLVARKEALIAVASRAP